MNHYNGATATGPFGNGALPGSSLASSFPQYSWLLPSGPFKRRLPLTLEQAFHQGDLVEGETQVRITEPCTKHCALAHAAMVTEVTDTNVTISAGDPPNTRTVWLPSHPSADGQCCSAMDEFVLVNKR